jgi:GTP-binding protein
LKVNNARYECTAVNASQYPVSALPEIAFVGRSNVGKSSIINSLLNRKNLARTSSTPGKTREINFYNIDDKLHFVDLPGYGYASVSKEKKGSWAKIIEEYLYTRQQLKALILLVDIRHLPTKDDKTMYEWIVAHNINHFVVATKSDKIPRSQVKPKLNEIKKFLTIDNSVPVIPFSSVSRQGKEEIWDTIEGLIGVNEAETE